MARMCGQSGGAGGGERRVAKPGYDGSGRAWCIIHDSGYMADSRSWFVVGTKIALWLAATMARWRPIFPGKPPQGATLL